MFVHTTRVTGIALAAVFAVAITSCGPGGSGETVAQHTAAAGAPEAPNTDQPLSAAERMGRDEFVRHCGSCHTLEAAGTIGQIGPNLGDIAITEADILRAIRTGGGGHSHGAGGRTGNMPRNLVTGKEARDVASFVAANASGSETP
jgi:mono/diheme cytochrome c family protein